MMDREMEQEKQKPKLGRIEEFSEKPQLGRLCEKTFEEILKKSQDVENANHTLLNFSNEVISEKKGAGRPFGCTSTEVDFFYDKEAEIQVTPRHQQIMNLQLSGLSKHEIAAILGISYQTVGIIARSQLYQVGLQRQQEEVQKETLGLISAVAAESLLVMRDIMRHSPSEKERMKASIWLLESAGFKGVERHEHVVSDLAEMTKTAYQIAKDRQTSESNPTFEADFQEIDSQS